MQFYILIITLMIQPQLKMKPHVTTTVVAMHSNIDSNKELMNEYRVRRG